MSTPKSWLETDRLLLRRFTPDDRGWLCDLYDDADVTRYLGGRKTPAKVDELLRERILDYYDAFPGFGMWMTVERATGERVGFHLLNNIQGVDHPVGFAGEVIGAGASARKWPPRWCATASSISGCRPSSGSPTWRMWLAACAREISLERRGERAFAHRRTAEGPLAWFDATTDWLGGRIASGNTSVPASARSGRRCANQRARNPSFSLSQPGIRRHHHLALHPVCGAPSRKWVCPPTPSGGSDSGGARGRTSRAQTGSGKTAAFLLPILQGLIDAPRGKTRALVLAPTRELAAQILEDLKDLATHTPVTGAAVYGGVGHGPQEHAFRSGVDVLIATPGRLLDHLRSPYARLDHIQYLVLDEADRMFDMGFLPEIRKILRHLPARRQTLFFSATMPPPIRTLANEMLHHPVTIERERQGGPPVGITQAAYPVAQELKSHLLAALLRRGDMTQALVFTRTKHRANRLADFLVREGVRADRIHGNRSQSQRTAALASFKSGRVPVLVATDIAARGIDVDALGHVVNFDVPLAPEDYIHRVGRTGRAEATGEAFTFFSPEEQGELAAIERVIGRKLPRVTVPDFDYAARPQARLEIPIAQRIAEIRARKAQERQRRDAKGGHGGSGRHGAHGGHGTHGGHAGPGVPHAKRRFRPRRRPCGGNDLFDIHS
jgi:ATP-dependent RNA helicase RhlE